MNNFKGYVFLLMGLRRWARHAETTVTVDNDDKVTVTHPAVMSSSCGAPVVSPRSDDSGFWKAGSWTSISAIPDPCPASRWQGQGDIGETGNDHNYRIGGYV